jgi:peptide/nickel transport system substrate-binding protein
VGLLGIRLVAEAADGAPTGSGRQRDPNRVAREERGPGLAAARRDRRLTKETIQMSRRSRSIAGWVLALMLVAPGLVLAAPEGQMSWGLHFSLAPTLFEPAETPGVVSPFMILYALHDALVKPMPGKSLTPSLAESWSVSSDGLVYEFVLRKGVRFHNGEPVTADDAKFSFDRYRGISAKMLKDKVAAVEVPDAGRVRFRLKQPWPDFMTFYGTPATGAAWVVPKKYVEKVGEDGFKKAPVGAGPYRFVSFTPGVELVLEAAEGYWRKTPSVKRLVFKSAPDVTTRVVMLKRGDVDVAYALSGELGDEVRRTAGLTLRPTPFTSTHWLFFADQFETGSPWHDRRVRLAATHAVDRQAINQAENLGFSKITGSIIPTSFEFYWQPPVYPFDLAKAKQLLTEAGYPRGFEAGDLWCDVSTTGPSEATLNYLQGAGIKARLRPLERAAFLGSYREKKLKNLIFTISGIFGNAATRIDAFTASSGIYAYGAYPDIDGLFREQANELDPKKREAILHRIQQLMHEKVMYLPIWQLSLLNGYGPRVGEAGLGLIADYPWSAPYEDVTLKAK